MYTKYKYIYKGISYICVQNWNNDELDNNIYFRDLCLLYK